MKTLRSCLGGATAIALLGVAGTVSAADVTLQIVRDGNGSIIQSIPVDSWSFDARRRVLEVTSTSADRHCAGAPGASTEMRLNLDGQWYGLKHFTPPSRSRPTLRVYPLADRVFPLCRSGSNRQLVQQRYESKAVGDLKIELDVISGGRSARRPFAVGGAITHDFAAGVINAGNAKAPSTQSEDWPPLCLQGSGGGTQLAFTDPNGKAVNLQGVTPTAYRYSDKVLELNTGPQMNCFAVPSIQESPLAKGEPTGCGQGSGIFGSSFESTANLAIDELGVMVQVNTFPTADLTDPLDYDLIVQNCSSQDLADVAVRDFYSSSSAAVSGDYQSFKLPLLAAGAQHVVGVTRTVTGGALHDEVVLTAVAAVSDGSTMPKHQIKSWSIPVVDTNNLAPTLTGSASLTMDEDGLATTVDGVLTASDDDSGFNCSGGSCVQVSSSDSSIIAPSGVSAAFDTGAITLSVTPQPNAYTAADQTVNLSVRVQDADGALSNAITVPVTVTAVNDPPTFEIGAGFDETGAKILTPSPTPYCTLVQTSANGDFVLANADCPTHSWPSGLSGLDAVLDYNGWIANWSAGPNETGTVSISMTVSDPFSVLGTPFLETDLSKATAGDLEYQGTGAKGTATLTVTATDSNGESTSINVIVDVANSSPTITSNGGGNAAAIDRDENDTTPVTTVTADDADDEPATLTYAISGTDSGDFEIDSSSGELTFAAPPDFEAPADSNGDNVYLVTVTVSDSTGGSDSQALTVTVADANEAPVIVAASTSFQVQDTAQLDDVVVPTSNFADSFDPEGATLTNWRIISGNDVTDTGGARPFAQDQLTGEILVNDPSNFQSTTTTSFNLEVVVSDAASGGLDSDPVIIQVEVVPGG